MPRGSMPDVRLECLFRESGSNINLILPWYYQGIAKLNWNLRAPWLLTRGVDSDGRAKTRPVLNIIARPTMEYSACPEPFLNSIRTVNTRGEQLSRECVTRWCLLVDFNFRCMSFVERVRIHASDIWFPRLPVRVQRTLRGERRHLEGCSGSSETNSKLGLISTRPVVLTCVGPYEATMLTRDVNTQCGIANVVSQAKCDAG